MILKHSNKNMICKKLREVVKRNKGYFRVRLTARGWGVSKQQASKCEKFDPFLALKFDY